MISRICLILSLSAALAGAAPYELPSSRAPNSWARADYGVPGGIPARDDPSKVIDVTQSPYTADPTGATASTSTIQAAIDAAGTAAAADGTYRVVYLPAGTYQFTQLTIGASKRNITLRGAGVGQTIISSGVVAMGGSFTAGPTTTITAGLTKGSTSLTVSSGTGFYSNGIAKIYIENDPTVPIVSPIGLPTLRTLVVKVGSVSGSTITLDTPIPYDFSGMSATIVQNQNSANYHFGCGVEDMEFTGASANRSIYLQTSYGNWVKGVKVSGHNSKAIQVEAAARAEIRETEIGFGNGGGPGKFGLGIESSSSRCLIEDNIIYGNFPGIQTNGVIANVFAYNFFVNATSSLNINENHQPHSMLNLWEGNITPNFTGDGYWGSASDNTLYRNWITGINNPASPVAGYAVALKRFIRNYSLIGNIVQTAGYTWTYNGLSLGLPNLGNSSSTGTAKPSIGTWWVDWNTSTNAPWVWPVAVTSVTINGASKATGTATFSGDTTSFSAHLAVTPLVYFSPSPNGAQSFTVSSFDGSAFNFISTENAPSMTIGAYNLTGSALGWQELDLDVEESLLLKANTSIYEGGIPAGQGLADGETLADSWVYSSKPTFFGNLAWPPFNPFSPNRSFEAIPAGYRYENGGSTAYLDDGEPPPEGGTATIQTLNVTGSLNIAP